MRYKINSFTLLPCKDISVSSPPRVTAVARKNPGHSAKSASGKLQLTHMHHTYVTSNEVTL